jgi:hypothetical protein
LRLIQRLFEGFGCLGFPKSFEIGDRLDCGFTRPIGAHEWQRLVRSVLGLLLMGELCEPTNDHAAMHRHCEPTFAPAQSSALYSVNVAISLAQALTSAKAVGRAVAHAELFEAEPTAWCIVHEPELFASGSALRAAKIGPRSAVRELCMGDADELLFVTEGARLVR